MGIIRKTKSVELLMQIFEQRQGAHSAPALVKHLRKEINKTTVYRTLERLKDEGVLHSFVGKDGLKWYAKCNGCSPRHHKDTHPHFQCRDCGKIECVSVEVPIPSIPNYEVESAELLLVGLCKDCRE